MNKVYEEDNMDDQTFERWADHLRALDKAWLSGLRWGCFWASVIWFSLILLAGWFASPI